MEFLVQIIRKINFGANFVRWMKILYTNPVFRLKNHGWISKTCNMNRGIRQGCPISALLYIFVAEILAQKINTNDNIHGFKTNNMDREIKKNIQHADDLTVALRDEISMKNTIDTINEFCLHAGSKVNLAKTECLLLGNLKGLYNEIYGVKVSMKVVKVLGIYIGHDKIECYSNNWTKVYDDMQKLFESWKRRKLTIFGKTCIINTLGISKLIYRASILRMPDDEFLKKTNRLIYNYLWKSRERIKRNTLIGNILEGGIGIVDIETKFKSLKAAWIPRFLKSNGNLRYFIDNLCSENNIDLNNVLKTNVRNIVNFSIVNNLPVFYKEVFCFFNECKTIVPLCKLNTDVFLQQIIWNNTYFTVRGKPLLFDNWLKSNIRYVKDLYDDDGNFYSIMHFSDIIINKSNWLCEYKVLRNIFGQLTTRFDCAKSKYVNIVNRECFLIDNTYTNICEQKSNFFYHILLRKKFQKPCYQNILAREFDITGSNPWFHIYKRKIKDIFDKEIAEFNHKLLNNILCNNFYLSKWKHDVTMYCKNCTNEVENTKHLLYECNNIKQIWYIIGTVLNFDIKWKHIVIGFYQGDSDYADFLNYFYPLLLVRYINIRCSVE